LIETINKQKIGEQVTSIKVDIAPSVLDWIINAVREEVPSVVVKSLSEWREGGDLPTFAKIKEISKKAHIPLGYFLLKTPPVEKLPLLNYRTIDSYSIPNASRELIDTIYQMEAIQEWVRDYRLSAETEKLNFATSRNNAMNPLQIAKSIRNILGIQIDWYSEFKKSEEAFKKLRKFIGKAGILVFRNGIVGSNTHRPLKVEEFRAFALADDIAPLIFINSNDSENGMLFSLVHETAHICMGTANLFKDRYSETETICNAVAAEILAPNKISHRTPKIFIKVSTTVINIEVKWY
jgi:Zn-dependent peptidase ImmA (M78 family)